MKSYINDTVMLHFIAKNLLDFALGMHVYTYPFTERIELSINRPYDFTVSEIVNGINIEEIIDKIAGDASICVEDRGYSTAYVYIVKKVNIDSIKLCNKLRSILRCSRCETLGLKDVRALAFQTVILYSCRDILKSFRISDGNAFIEAYLWLCNRTPLMYSGNRFKIKLHVEMKVRDELLRRFYTIGNLGNLVLNFFGYQRFGTVRPISHIVGKMIVKNNWDRVLEILCNYPFPSESRSMIENRLKWLIGEKGFESAFSNMDIERVCLKYEDSLRALKRLPRDLLRLFVNAYQSYLFNLTLSKLWLKILEIHGFPQALKILNNEYPYLPIVGAQSIYVKPMVREILEEIMSIEGIDADLFYVRDLGIYERGAYRRSLMELENVVYRDIEDGVLIEFSLEPGSYATVFIREITRGIVD